MSSLEFLHEVENFIGRDLTDEEAGSVIEMHEEEPGMYSDPQYVAELMMTREDYRRVYG